MSEIHFASKRQQQKVARKLQAAVEAMNKAADLVWDARYVLETDARREQSASDLLDRIETNWLELNLLKSKVALRAREAENRRTYFGSDRG